MYTVLQSDPLHDWGPTYLVYLKKLKLEISHKDKSEILKSTYLNIPSKPRPHIPVRPTIFLGNPSITSYLPI